MTAMAPPRPGHWPIDSPVVPFDYPNDKETPKLHHMNGVISSVVSQSSPPQSYASDQQPNGNVASTVAAGAGRAAQRALERLTRDSRLFRDYQGMGGHSASGSEIASIDPSDLDVGRMLGRGGFSEVHEAIWLPSSDAEEADGQETTCPKKRYAVKYLRASVMKDKKKFERGAADLAIEAKLLSAFDHPNIIKMHGITAGSIMDNIAQGTECSFFLVVDRLCDTLDNRMEAWKGKSERYSFLLYRATRDPRGTKRRAQLVERLRVALDLARAVQYLHDNSVAFRDIKPENIGFDNGGVLKLFDFGLAKEVKPSRRYADGTYRLTGNTGSRRYMAPEVAKARPYNLSVDSYSFGILLWEMLALEKPFKGYNELRHMQEVVEGGVRPMIDRYNEHSHWPAEVQDLIETCWDADWHERPTFVDIVNVLEPCADEDGSKHRRRFSSRSYSKGASPRIGGTQRVGSFVQARGEAV